MLYRCISKEGTVSTVETWELREININTVIDGNKTCGQDH